MAIRNTKQDAANTAVRALLTAKGETYLGEKYTKGSKMWADILDDFFYKCAYCEKELYEREEIEMEHLIMLNKEDVGLHHPGNTVPICKACNKRGRIKIYYTWQEHLAQRCSDSATRKQLEEKIKKQLAYYNYKELDEETKKEISLMSITKAEQHLKDIIKPTVETNHRVLWKEIKSSYNGKCAFCNGSGELYKVMIKECNQTEFGTRCYCNHVPACEKCKKREVKEVTTFYSWEKQLEYVCRSKGEEKNFERRRQIILDHVKKYGYQKILEESKEEIKNLAKDLYITVSKVVKDSIRKI
ncbi:HNH endonuclease [Priestia aryabhattai]|uniref:HNH endonuclease n=1 Tax=Priestia aryabhattai TaxID=412384 RepID=UPI003101A12D